jgi:hypothetical protein
VDDEHTDIEKAAQQLVKTLNSGQKVIDEACKYGVHVSPEVITVDPKTSTATVKFVNPTDDSVQSHISVQDAVPVQGVAFSNSIPTDTQTGVLGSWIKDLPKELTLKPHETRTIILHFAVPASRKPGEYSAYVLAYTEQSPTIKRAIKQAQTSNHAKLPPSLDLYKEYQPLNSGKLVYNH